MPIYQLHPHEIWFPPPQDFEPTEDVVAVGGSLSPAYLKAAYQQGIFPWFSENEPILWWHPQQRMVLKPSQVKVSKSSRNLWNQQRFTFTVNKAFETVIEQCQKIKRPGQEGGTWLNNTILESFIALHRQGHAHSVEAWRDDELVGGLYGFKTGAIFCGDSMFSKESNASKMAFIFMCRSFAKAGVELIDCQVHNHHLASLGAAEISRQVFIEEFTRLKNKTVSLA
jgi:leucyl/phenylalanyl-tRNA--protein transferase